MNNTSFRKRTREETSKQDDSRTSMASESSSHTQHMDSGKQDIISEEDSKGQKQAMDFKKRIWRKIQTEKVIAGVDFPSNRKKKMASLFFFFYPFLYSLFLYFTFTFTFTFNLEHYYFCALACLT